MIYDTNVSRYIILKAVVKRFTIKNVKHNNFKE